jgi:FkbM family methyltransferase
MKTYIKECRHGKFILISGDMICNYVNMYGEWSKTEVEFFAAILSDDANVIEIGSNIGMHAIPLSRICSAGKVFCYEPQRPVFHVLCGNVAINNRLNVVARHIGAGSESGIMEIATSHYDEPWNCGSFSLLHGFNSEGRYQSKIGKDSVNIVTLDSDLEVNSLNRLDMIKIDAEGFELNVLIGARGLIQRHKPYVFAEANSDAVVDRIISEMSQHDYVGYWFVNSRFRRDNYNACPFQMGGYDINIIFAPRNRLFPGCGALNKALDFGDIARGVPILDRFTKH